MTESSRQVEPATGGGVGGLWPPGRPGLDHDDDGRLDVRAYLARAGDLDEAGVLRLLGRDQAERWLDGVRIPAEAYLQLHPALRGDSTSAFELVYGEFVLRESLGELPSVEEFVWRFPRFADRLRRQLEIHKALRAEEKTAGPGGGDLGSGAGPGDEDGEGEPGRAAIGPQVWGFRIASELGRGGMGVVYKAWQTSLNRPVALKVIRAGTYSDPEVAARFRDEAELAARFQHPNIVQVYEVGESDGVGYLALEYAAGGSLSAKLAGSPQEPGEAARLVELLARALGYAHGRGIVHRDLKPANVVLTEEGVPKVTDFGLARLLEQPGGLTQSGEVVGTPSYMAPEQARGAASSITPATDVYALGAILYEMLTGRPPFLGATPLSTLEQVSGQEPLPPAKLQRHTPRDLEVICLKCLEKDPARRYPSAEDLADDLRRFLDGRPIVARPSPGWERAWKWARRRPAGAAALATVAAAALTLVAGGLVYNARLRAAVQTARAAQREADASARAAHEQRNLTLKTINRLVSLVKRRLGTTPATRSVRQAALDTAVEGLEEIARGTAESAPDLSRAVAHQELGDIFRRTGRTADARRQYEQARRLAEARAGGAAPDVTAAECLHQTYIGLGELCLTADDPVGARRYFRRGVELAEALEAAGRTSDELRQRRIEAYLELGRSHSFAGDLAEAEAWFRKSRDLARRWEADAPGNLQASDLLASSYRKLADVRKLAGDAASAADDYLKAIAIARRLVAAEPGNLEFTSHLAVALDDLAGIASSGNDPDRARALFGEAAALFKGIAEADPEDVEAQIKLIQTEHKLARVEMAGARFEPAAALLRGALDRLTQLDHQGKLAERPSLRSSQLKAMTSELPYCEAAPGALRDLASARAQPAPLAARLLLLRARTRSGVDCQREVAEAAEALAGLAATAGDADADGLYEVARALASFTGDLDANRIPCLEAPLRPDLRRRCAERAVAALAGAVDRGFHDPRLLENDHSFSPLRQDPGYRSLVERLKRAPDGR
jgi:tetratricopeptide (TPR) repeat protein/predicted Ser/Thr protein kinase